LDKHVSERTPARRLRTPQPLSGRLYPPSAQRLAEVDRRGTPLTELDKHLIGQLQTRAVAFSDEIRHFASAIPAQALIDARKAAPSLL